MPRTSVAKKPVKGVRITKGSKWRLIDVGGRHREFPATVLESWSFGTKRVVILSVPPRPREKRQRAAP